MRADRVDDAGEALFLQRLSGRAQRGTVDHFGGAQRLEVIRFTGLAGGGDDGVAPFGEDGDGHAADAAGGAGDQDLALFLGHAELLHAHHRKHRGIAGSAERHRLAGAEFRGQGNQPVALQSRFLRQATPMGFTHAPAVQHHLVAWLEVGVAGALDRTGQVDARHHRPLAHHRALVGDRQAVLVVEGRVIDTHRDVTVRHLRLVDVTERGIEAGLGFAKKNALHV